MTIQERYEWACSTESDIRELIPILRKYGEQCSHITEFGTNRGVSTSAWLAAKPKHLVCYDVGRYPSVDEIAFLANSNDVGFRFIREDTAYAIIEPTELLFIDTVHHANHLRLELMGNHLNVKKLLIFHDTEIYGLNGEGGAPGMWTAILQLLTEHNAIWRILEVRPESNGLTVLQRI